MRVLGVQQCRGGGPCWSATRIPASVFGDVQISAGNAVAGFFYVIGNLIMVCSGGCSIFIFAASLGGGALGILPFIAVVGGLPFALGLVIVLDARRAIDRAKTE